MPYNPYLFCLSLSFYPPTLYHFRFDAWIPVCHSTCNTAYWLVLDDPSRHKTPAHRSSALTLQMLLPTSWRSTRRRRGLARAALLTHLLVHTPTQIYIVTYVLLFATKGKGYTKDRIPHYRKWNVSIIVHVEVGKKKEKSVHWICRVTFISVLRDINDSDGATSK